MKSLAGYHIRFKSFSGPFDVLLELVAARKLDIREVNLEQLTADYIKFLSDSLEEGIELAPDFIYVAALLLNIKASATLREELMTELDELPLSTSELLDALKKLAPVKNAARSLKGMIERSAGSLTVSVKLPENTKTVKKIAMISPEELRRSVNELEKRKVPQIREQYVKSFIFEIEQSIEQLKSFLSKRRKIRLGEITKGARKRQLISMFFAALCLEAEGMAELRQLEPFTDIEIEVL